MDIIQTIILAIIEGLTEFLPVSSTGHMLLAKEAMGMSEDNPFIDTFIISIQLGAILAIVLMYIKRFLQSWDIYFKLFVAFVPTGIIGLLAYKTIKTLLMNSIVVSVALIVGGIILILIDKRVVNSKGMNEPLEKIPFKNAFFIGLIQSLSMIPGTSRAAATIIGGVFNGLNKKQATEFSFLLAVPTMIAATGYDLLKSPIVFTNDKIIILIIGLIGAFISAWIAVKVFLRVIDKFGFKHFGYYRIIIGTLFLILYFTGILVIHD